MKTAWCFLFGALLVVARDPAAAESPQSPIPLSCPWMASETFAVGTKCGGLYENMPDTHLGKSKYAIDFHLWPNCTLDEGFPLMAMADGTVTTASATGGFGNLVVLNHGREDGKAVESYYAHQQLICVRKGESVQRGQVVGFLGTTGRSTGPHLHAEVRHGGQSVRMTPMDGQTMTNNMALLSHNTGVFDREYAANGGAGTFGSLANPGNTYAGVHWYNDYNAANLYRVQGVPNNCCAQDYQGGIFGRSIIVYDALGGVLRAFMARTAGHPEHLL